jgi:hypothetical protein
MLAGCIALAAASPSRAALLMPDRLLSSTRPAPSILPRHSLPADPLAPLRPPRRQGGCAGPATAATLLKKYDRALRRYSSGKMRTMLEQHFHRTKDGTTLSEAFPDYRDYLLVVRLKPDIDTPVTDFTLQKDFYAFKEGSKIVMAPDIMWMAESEKQRVVRELIAAARPQWTFDAYRREADKTLEVATKKPFALDCPHKQDLSSLISHSVDEMRSSDDSRVISPLRFGSLLTILRGYITYSYYQSLGSEEFEERFNEMVKALGNQAWAHQKLSRLLGLHVIGRIEPNRNFRRLYGAAITNAAAKYPRVPRKWIEQIIWIETRGDPKSISRAGAYGLMQLMPLVYLGVGPDKVRQFPLSFETTINPFDPSNNIERGAAFLDKLQRHMAPTIRSFDPETRRRMIFHAYNGGVSRVVDLVRKYGRGYVSHLPDETQSYLDRLDDFPQDVSGLAGP